MGYDGSSPIARSIPILLKALPIFLIVGWQPSVMAGGSCDTIRQLLANDGLPEDDFGYSISSTDEVVVIGVPSAEAMSGDTRGAAYVFTIEGNEWVQEQKLMASDGLVGDRFGESLRVSGAT